MKCKECGAKIPDNYKFCIDCGALTDPPEEKDYIHVRYDDEGNRQIQQVCEQQNKIQQSHPRRTIQPLKKGVFVVIILFAVVSILITIAATFIDSANFLNENEDYAEDHVYEVLSVDYNDGYADEQEKLALEYVESYIKGMDYETFDKLTALDAEKVYNDIMNNHMAYYSFSSEEQLYNALEDVYDEPVSDIHSHISADLKSFANSKLTYFADMYSTEDISVEVTYSWKIDGDLLYEYYYSNTDSILENADRKTSDYLPDCHDITDIYDICVDFIINDGFETYHESVWIVVADTGNGPQIVYDELLITEMFNIINY